MYLSEACTPDSLLQLASNFREFASRHAAAAPSSTAVPSATSPSLPEQALICALWMASEGLRSLRFVGPFGPALPPPRSLCWVLEGSLVAGEADPPGAGRMTTMRELVRLQATAPGRVDVSAGMAVVAPRVHWIDADGTPRWTDANNVEQVSGRDLLDDVAAHAPLVWGRPVGAVCSVASPARPFA